MKNDTIALGKEAFISLSQDFNEELRRKNKNNGDSNQRQRDCRKH